jgi:beta-fructofuranosidase
MLRLPDAWVWDSWYLDDGQRFHAFYLKASRALVDPDRRHHRASIGHAVSDDLVAWTELPDAMVAADGPAFDDLATWTGSTLVDTAGRGHLFYTGICRETGDRIQRIGHAVSDDLVSWHRVGEPPVAADSRWYETAELLGHSPWRDPWVLRDESAGCWRMLVTASTAAVVREARGCIGTAVSHDLLHWTVEPPLTAPTGLHQLEVPQTLLVDGSWLLVWCMRDVDLGPQAALPADGGPPITGTWTAPAESAVGPFHLERAEPIRVDGCYAGRVVIDRAGRPVLLSFVDRDADGEFGGWITDPVPLALTGRGTLQPAQQ